MVADVAASDAVASVLHAGASGRAVVTTYTADQDDPLVLGSVDLGVDFSGSGGARFGSPTDRLAAAAGNVWVVAGAYGSRGGVLSGAYGSRGGVLAVDLRRERVSTRLDIPGMNAVAVGEGGVWLVGAQRLSRLDRFSTVDLQIALPSPGYAADAAIGEGAVWALTTPHIEFPIDRYRTTVGAQGPIRRGRGILTRVDPKTTAVATTVELGGRPETVAAGLGSVWITEPEQNVLIRVDPETNMVAERIPLGGRPTAVTLGGGLVWVSIV